MYYYNIIIHIHCRVQAKKKPKKFQKGRVAQQKAKGERKPVASEKVIKEVKDWYDGMLTCDNLVLYI